MPDLNDVKRAVTEFLKQHAAYVAEPQVKAQLLAFAEFARTLRAPGNVKLHDVEHQRVSANVVDWLRRLPEPLLDNGGSFLVDLKTVERLQAHRAIIDGLQVVALGTKAAVGSGTPPPKRFADTLLQIAFGIDGASQALRRPLLDSKAGGLPPTPSTELIGLKTLPDIQKIVLAGTLREFVQTIARCGYEAQRENARIGRVQSFGRVTGLHAARRCAGETLTIDYAGFGSSPPAVEVREIFVSLPTRQGCVHVPLRRIDAAFYTRTPWTDAGTISVPFPTDAIGGCVGFLAVPVSPASDTACVSGTLVQAAGMVQSILVKVFGPQYGALHGQMYVEVAEQAEARRHTPLPCAACQADGLNRIEAGVPFINHFRAVERGAIHPRGTLTLQWSVSNADRVTIEARDIPASENQHELPNVPGLLDSQGSIVLNVPCTRRWEAQLVLHASNGNGCSAAPVEIAIDVSSGFSHYRIGCAKTDVTDRRVGLRMLGFAYKRQETTGIHKLLYARAFYIEENSAVPRPPMLTIVVADIWSCTQIVRREVIRRLNARFGATAANPRFTVDNLLIAGTHTHAGPGGYSEYFLYNLSIDGFDDGVFETVVNGIVNAVDSAVNTAVSGRIYAHASDLANCGANRSLEAYKCNPEFASAPPEDWTDREMLLLKFMADVDNRGHQRPLGALNWFAIHPTSLGMFNTRISGDNKGVAAELFESEMAAPPRAAGGFVAAFANGCAGDVSGNLTLDSTGEPTIKKPMGGDARQQLVVPLFPPRSATATADDLARTELLGRQQFEHALSLFDSATSEIAGPLQGQNVFIDMSNIAIAAQPGERTWPAALGVSFGAGSSEDSIAYVTEGVLDIDVAIKEGMNKAAMATGDVEFWTLALPKILPVAGALLVSFRTGTPPAAPILGSVLSLIADLAKWPNARAYAAGKLGAMMFGNEVSKCPPQTRPNEGNWRWNVPSPASLPATYLNGHGDKPVMFPVGLCTLTFQPGTVGRQTGGTPEPCPLVPNVIPLQLLRIGSVVVAGVPSEFTSTSGRRLKRRLGTAFTGVLTHVAVSNFSNGYSGYVATLEEYRAQHYEGASTLYGPQTLEAYMQTFDGLAARLQGSSTVGISGERGPFVVPAIYRKLSA